MGQGAELGNRDGGIRGRKVTSEESSRRRVKRERVTAARQAATGTMMPRVRTPSKPLTPPPNAPCSLPLLVFLALLLSSLCVCPTYAQSPACGLTGQMPVLPSMPMLRCPTRNATCCSACEDVSLGLAAVTSSFSAVANLVLPGFGALGSGLQVGEVSECGGGIVTVGDGYHWSGEMLPQCWFVSPLLATLLHSTHWYLSCHTLMGVSKHLPETLQGSSSVNAGEAHSVLQLPGRCSSMIHAVVARVSVHAHQLGVYQAVLNEASQACGRAPVSVLTLH